MRLTVSLISAICKERPLESMMDEKFMMPELVSSDPLTKWKVIRKKMRKRKAFPFNVELIFF